MPSEPEAIETRVKFSERAVAYLKAANPPVPKDGPVMKLSHEDSPVLRPYADGLCTAYLVDDGDRFIYVQNRHLAQDDINEEQLHEIGLRNLTEVGKRLELKIQSHHYVYFALMGGNFEASLILLDQLWDGGFRKLISGEYAIAVPNRDILAFCDSTSSAGLHQLRDLIDRLHSTGDHPISNRIYVRRQNKWEPQE